MLLPACGKAKVYRFLNPSDEITEIAIINVSSAEGDNLTETEIQRIEDTDTFLEEFRKIGCHTYFGDPISVLPEGEKSTVIKISYQNGSYGLINWNGQTEYTPEKGLKYYAGYSVFDEDQFKSLISKYAPYSFTQSYTKYRTIYHEHTGRHDRDTDA